MSPRPQLVVLGIDAGDPGFIERWAAEGRLPTIASLMERGFWGRTAGPEFVCEHGLWISLLSGVSRGRHGYYYFRQLEPGTYDLRGVTGRDFDAPPFWVHLRGTSRTVAVIDAPEMMPLPGLEGVQLANWATHTNWNPNAYPLAAEPPALLEVIRADFGPKQVVPERHDSTEREDRRLYAQLLENVERKGALCRSLVARDDFDLVVAVFGESHTATHQFWRYQLDGGGDGLAPAICSVYEAIDHELGLLLDELRREADVFVVSSVGMDDHFPTTHLIDAFLEELGYQTRAAPGPPSVQPLALARRVLPERWRVALSRGLSREVRERLLADQFRSATDWRRTRAFAIPASCTSFLRVNLRGREPEGIVEPGTEYAALLDELEADLRLLVDADTGEPAVRVVARTVDLFGESAAASLPDLFVSWKPGRFMERVLHPRAVLEQRRPDFYRRSDHSRHGFAAAAGPRLPCLGAVGEISPLDLAPTFLALLGAPVPEAMDGKPLAL